MTRQKSYIPLTKAGQQARKSRKKPSPDQRIKYLHAFAVAYMHQTSENKFNDDLSIVSTAFLKVLYGMGMAVNKSDKTKTRAFMIEVLDSIRQQVAEDAELKEGTDAEEKPEEKPDGNEQQTEG